MKTRILAATAALACALLVLNSPAPAAPPAYPLKISANGRYLVDQHNTPVLIVGESPQSLTVNLTTNDAALFFTNRASHTFNTVWVNLLCATYTGGRADASTYDGMVPFTATVPASVTSGSTVNYDLTTPNEAFFSRVDQMINLAAAQGIQVMLDACETGSFLSVMLNNGTNRCRAYGRYLGNRYKSFPNIIWMSGNDFQTWRTPGDDTVVRAVALGIRDTDTNHLQTSELDYLLSSSLDDANWDPILGVNGTYTYFPTYARVQQDYNRTNFLPTILMEANYEFESLQGPVTTAPILRQQEYWTMTSGACGQMYGNGYTWPFSGGWQNELDTPGAIEMGYLSAFFWPRAWYNLIPDTNHSVVTSGYGTYSDSGHVADNDYLTDARTTDGSLVVIYTPVVRQFAVDMSQVAGPAAAHWFDPAAGVYHAMAGSPLTNHGIVNFTPPGTNADGDGGWVLVLETNPPPISPPPPAPSVPRFVQMNYATPQMPQSQVSVAYPASQTAGNANLLIIGWNDGTNQLVAVNDSAGNHYQTALATFRGNGMGQAIYYAPNIAPGSNMVTVSFDHPATYVDLRAMEYSGLAVTNTFDSGASATGSGTMAACGPVVTAGTNELLVAAGMTAGAFSAAGPGYALRAITAPDADLVEDAIAAANGTNNATASLDSSTWLLQLAAFRPAAAGVPNLRIFPANSNRVTLAWSASGDFVLQQSTDLAGTNWVAVTNQAQVVGAEIRSPYYLPPSSNSFAFTPDNSKSLGV